MAIETISFPRVWKSRYGFTGAAILSYLVDNEQERGDWFPALAKEIKEATGIYPSSMALARERLRGDQVINVKHVGNRYEYQIQHDRLNQLNNEEN